MKLEEMVRLQEIAESRENLWLGAWAGVALGVICAFFWAALTVGTGVQVSFVAMGFGYAVGGAVWIFGRGMSAQYGFTAAAIALGSIILGNALCLPVYIAQQYGVGLFEVFEIVKWRMIAEYMKASFQFVDIVFYLLAAVFAYKVAFKELEKQIEKGYLNEPDWLENRRQRHNSRFRR